MAQRFPRAALHGIVLFALSVGSAPAQEVGPEPVQRLVSIDIRSMKDLLAASQFGESLACHPGPGIQEFLVPAENMAGLDASGLAYEVKAQDIRQVIDAWTRDNDAARAARGGFYTAYHTLDEVNAYLDTLDNYPGLPSDQVQKFSIGKTVQGREIYALKITAPPIPGAPQKPVFLFNGCQHAREWVTVPTAIYAAEQLISLYGADPEITGLVNNVEFYIVPVANPDGYAYSWSSGSARLWRKNRRANSGGSFGVDLNRNWGYQWGGPGASTTPSSDTYRGTGPFSEPETQRFRDFVLGNAAAVPPIPPLPNLKAYVDIHSYSQLVMSPWGYTSATPPRIGELTPLTLAQLSAVSGTNGATYTGGPIGQVLYLASGGSSDWAFGATGAIGYAYEVRDTGQFGFVLPADQILPTATEIWNGLKVLATHIQIRLEIAAISPPSSVNAGSPTGLSVSLTTQNRYAVQPGSPKLFWRIGGSGPFGEAALGGSPPAAPGPPPSGGSETSTMTATLAPVPCGQVIQYFVQAIADDGTVVSDPPLAPGLYYSALASACPECTGDADGNQLVNFADITAVLSSFGAVGPTGQPGDANHDGTVDFTDVTAILANFGAPCPGS